MEKLLVFDVSGNMGHFRKPYTTTSPLTYPFPPRPALCGLIGAIMGIERDEYSQLFSPDNCRIALRILGKTRKLKIGINYLNTDSGFKSFYIIKNRKQIPVEFLVSPAYRIYFHHNDEKIYGRLKSLLENHETEFTPCLGLAYLLADYNYIGEFPVEISNFADRQEARINSVVVMDGKTEIIFDGEGTTGKGEYFSSRMPHVIEEKTVFHRKTLEYANIVYENNGEAILCKTANYGRVLMPEPENIVFL
ncbi:MAG: type I-B CRISPR-associated protein Cas5b [Firmicutes bacterium]|nr:type I-B CRISPR-associated protein Cas5b [Bacillota bacterium]